MSEKKEFVKGLFPKKRKENAPSWILSSGSIKIDDMIQFLQEKKATGLEWLNYDILQPRDQSKKPYAVVNDWKPEQETQQSMHVDQALINENKQEEDTINIKDIPF